MEVVIGQLHLGAVGGTETYALTVAEQLQGLGHGVTVFTLELGQSAALGLARGLEIRGSEDELPEACDIVLANDAVTAYRLAERYPTAVVVFVVHADEYDLCVPPQVPDVVQAAVVVHDRVGRRVRALGHVPEVVRLHQPVDTKRFLPRTPLRDPARRVLMLGNWVHGDRRDLVFDVCASLGLDCVQLGFRGDAATLEPELEIGRADIVIGKGRVIIEAMACGRAAYVYDHNGGDGWVTPDRYALLEADNFGGQAEPTVIDANRLRRDLAGYSRLMGPVNRDLAFVNHSANRHAQSLVELFQQLVPGDRRVVAPLRELARLVRVGWLSEWRAVHWAAEAQRLRAELDERPEPSETGRRRKTRLFLEDGRQPAALPPRSIRWASWRGSRASDGRANGGAPGPTAREPNVLAKSDRAPNLVVGERVTFGERVVLGANVVIHDGVEIGDDCTIQDSVVLGKTPVLAPTSSASRDPLGPLVIGEGVTIGSGAIVFAGARIGAGAIIGDQTHVRERAVVGRGTVVGRGSAIGSDARLGARVRIQTNVWLTSWTIVEDDVFVGPGVVTTNDASMARDSGDVELQGPILRRACRVGGGVVLAPGVEVGEEAFLAAGAVVIRDVPPRTWVMSAPGRGVRQVQETEQLR